jgi:hypothetical protein
MKKINIWTIGCCLMSIVTSVYGLEFYDTTTYSPPKPTVRKEVRVPSLLSLTWKSYIKGLTTDEIKALINLLNTKINTVSGHSLKKYEKMKKFAEDTLNRYETYADRM